MKRMSKLVALAVASFFFAGFLSGCASMCGGPEQIKCAGLMTGKGPDEGWVYMSKEECMAHGGTIVHH